MRVSADRDDPGYLAYVDFILAHGGVRIFCNGRQLSHVITADDIGGYALCIAVDDRGQVKALADGEVMTYLVRGVITFAKGPPLDAPKAEPVDFFSLNREFSS